MRRMMLSIMDWVVASDVRKRRAVLSQALRSSYIKYVYMIYKKNHVHVSIMKNKIKACFIVSLTFLYMPLSTFLQLFSKSQNVLSWNLNLTKDSCGSRGFSYRKTRNRELPRSPLFLYLHRSTHYVHQIVDCYSKLTPSCYAFK